MPYLASRKRPDMTDSQAQHRTVYLADYRPPDFSIDSVDLHFTLDEATTRVHSRMAVRRNRPVERGR